MSQDIFFELGLEELPSGLVKHLAKDLLDNILSALHEAEISYGSAQHFATPRRIALLIKDVAPLQASKKGTKKGPSESAPPQAIEGFARSVGADVTSLRLEKQAKGAWWVYDFEEPGVVTKEWLPQLIQEKLTKLAIPKPMRWGNEKHAFARPAHWSILMYGKELINTVILGTNTDNKSYGHRFLHPQAVTILSADDYVGHMYAAKVLVDFDTRRQEIERQIQQIAVKHSWNIPVDEELLDEITSIVEWPEVMVGRFSEDFLEVPADVLIASMQEHQKCLPIYNQQHELQAAFIFVANIISMNPQSVILGNEKVMRARLSDAAFFYAQDRQQPLIEYAAQTAQTLFEKRLGSIADKTARVKKIMEYLTPKLGLEAQTSLRAVALSKCDLMTQMVAEFPDLQGKIGAYYALQDKEDSGVAQALFEQYLPRFAGDQLPESQLGWAMSLADRLDTLVGIFAIGLKPTGDKDPYKLRRNALAVVRLLLQQPNQLHISELLSLAAKNYTNIAVDSAVLVDLKKFIIERLQSHWHTHYPNEVFLAGIAVQHEELYDLAQRMQAFNDFKRSHHSEALFQVAKRVRQMLGNSEAHDDYAINPQELAEQQLWQVLQEVRQHLANLLPNQEYSMALSKLALLAEPLNMFFDNVFIMDEDLHIRNSRLKLLFAVQQALNAVVLLGL